MSHHQMEVDRTRDAARRSGVSHAAPSITAWQTAARRSQQQSDARRGELMRKGDAAKVARVLVLLAGVAFAVMAILNAILPQ